MTCPEDNADWFKGFIPLNSSSFTSNRTYESPYTSKSKGLYHCEYTENDLRIKYYFYVEGKGE